MSVAGNQCLAAIINTSCLINQLSCRINNDCCGINEQTCMTIYLRYILCEADTMADAASESKIV